MSEVASRYLRNHTTDALRRSTAGEEITITHYGRSVAKLVSINTDHRRPMTRAQFIEFLETGGQAEPQLRDELAALVDDTTEYRGPIS